MMNNLSTVARTIGTAELIDFFIREFPHIGRRIKQAKNAGHDIQEILNELQGLDKKELKAREKKASIVDKGNNPLISASDYTSQTSAEQNNQLTPKNVGIAGLGLMAAAGLSPYASTIASSILPTGNPQTPGTPPSQPLQPGAGLSQQIHQQAQSPVSQAMQAAPPEQVGQAAQAIPPTEPTQNIFQELTKGIDPSTLDPEKQQQLQFLGMISDQLQGEGKDLNDPAFQRLTKKIQDIIKGKPGVIIRESARFEAGKEDQSKAALQEALPGEKATDIQKRLKIPYVDAVRLIEKRDAALQQNPSVQSSNPPVQSSNPPENQEKRIDPDIQYPREFFKGKKKQEIEEFANQKLQDAFSQVEKGISEGEDYGVFHGDEWQAVGHKDVNEGSPIAPNEPKRNIQPGKKLIQVIEEHVPIRGLYHYYFDTPEKRKRMPFNKFSRGYEKAIEEMIVRKTNPELYADKQKKENEFLTSIQKNEMPKSDLFDDMQEVLEQVLFRQYDDEFEDYLTQMIKKIR